MSDTERKLAETLDALHDWNIDDITVAELASLLNTRMRCRIDENALDEAGLSPDHSLGGLHARQLSTRVALHHLLRDTDLAWMIRDGQLVLTTPEQVEDNLRLLVLPVVDLIETPGYGPEGYDDSKLIDLITSTVACYWDPGGPEISTFSGTLVFHQPWEISDQIERILETLRRVKSHETDPTTVKKPWYGFPFDADRQPDFAHRITIELQSVTLMELVEELNKQTSLQVRLNQGVLETCGWDASTRVRLLAHDEPLWPALRGALQRHELDLAYDYPFLMITVKEDAARQCLRVYPIHDLVNDTSVRPDFNGSLVRAQDSAEGYADDIVDLVTSVIDYGSWRELGGEGVIQVSKVPLALVISQSLDNHERIEELLRRLRELPKLERDPTMSRVAVYRLSPEVPVEQTIALLRQLVPDAQHDHREGENPTYLDSFGQGILVCHTTTVHRRIEHVLWSLGLLLRPSINADNGMGGFGPRVLPNAQQQ